jgi:hypothetical protein|tara:strand:- start:68 stop:313 length:246 start_codon:yes stop_codon:yes gene_type:complete
MKKLGLYEIVMGSCENIVCSYKETRNNFDYIVENLTDKIKKEKDYYKQKSLKSNLFNAPFEFPIEFFHKIVGKNYWILDKK